MIARASILIAASLLLFAVVVARARPVAVAAAPQDGRTARAVALLSQIGNQQPTLATVAFVVAWSNAEDRSNGAIERNNPWNTTMTGYGETATINGDGVRAYPTWETGLAATVATLTNGRYGELLAGLQTNDPERALRGLYASPWGTDARTVEAIYRSEGVAVAQPQVAATKCLPTKSGAIGASFSTTGDVWANVGQYGGMHLGDDFTGNPGESVFMPFDGVIESTSYAPDLPFRGWRFTARLADGSLLYIGHMQNMTVHDGDHIPACTQVGEIGDLNHVHVKMEAPGARNPCEAYGPPECVDFEQYFAAH